jgi:hypothetical protein
MRVFLLAGSLALIAAGAAGSAQESSSTQLQKLYAEYFDGCMKDWDTATHMTKKEWTSTCQRVANERAKFHVEQGGDGKSKQN